jgi:hypothetical protein
MNTSTGNEQADVSKNTNNQVNTIVQLAERRIRLWHTPDKRPFATAEYGDGGVRNLDIRGREFQYMLTEIILADLDSIPSSRLIKEAVERLAGKAIVLGDEFEAFARIAKIGDVIFIDLCDPQWRAIKIDESGWEVISDPPVHFTRTSGMNPLPHPVRGGAISEFRELLPGISFDDWIKLQGFLVGVFNPDGTQPMLVVSGRQGSGKSSTVAMVRDVIDPNQVSVRSMPKKIEEMFVATESSRLQVFDNVSYLTADQSDALAQILSGGGLTKRKLYSDTEEIAITTKQPIILNGITDVVDRADVDERALHIELEVMDPTERRLDSELRDKFNEMAPRLLGSILDAVSAALRNWNSVELDELPRLAELAKFVTAGESELQMEPGDFARVLKEQTNERSRTRAELDPVIVAIRDHAFTIMESVFEGTFQELLERIDEWLPGPRRSWTARKLSSAIKRVEADLTAIGIHLDRLGKYRNGRRIRLVHK